MASTFERLKNLLADTSEVGGITLTRGQCAMLAEILSRATIAEAKPLLNSDIKPNILIHFSTKLEREILRTFLYMLREFGKDGNVPPARRKATQDGK